MKITAIKQQVKNQSRYSIFVDEKYSFSLSELGLINSRLKVGEEIGEERLGELKDTARLDKAYNQALNLIARRMRSAWELESYLKRKGYDTSLSLEILNKLSDLGYVDDLKFAKAWVADRRLLRLTSKRKLQLELRQKRVEAEIIDKVLTQDQTDEQEVLKDLIKRKQKRYPDKLKLMQYLSRQGFSYDMIKSAMSGSEIQ